MVCLHAGLATAVLTVDNIEPEIERARYVFYPSLCL